MTAEEKVITRADLRNFGLTVGGILAVIALWPVLTGGQHPRLWALIISGIMVMSALVVPTALGPIYRAWMRIGAALGWVNTRIILGIAFYGLFTPMGAVMRVLGKDPLRRRFDANLTTYRVERSPRPGSHMQRQF